MIEIRNDSPLFFSFSFSEDEAGTPAAKRMLERIKDEIPHKQRYWIAEKKHWAIHRGKFLDFIEILAKFLEDKLEMRQGGMF